MTTTDTDVLAKRIGRILNDEGWTFEGVHEPGEYDECEECRLTVDPIAVRVAREVVVEADRDRWRQTALEERAAALDLLDVIKDRDTRIANAVAILDEDTRWQNEEHLLARVRDALDGDA